MSHLPRNCCLDNCCLVFTFSGGGNPGYGGGYGGGYNNSQGGDPYSGNNSGGGGGGSNYGGELKFLCSQIDLFFVSLLSLNQKGEVMLELKPIQENTKFFFGHMIMNCTHAMYVASYMHNLTPEQLLRCFLIRRPTSWYLWAKP